MKQNHEILRNLTHNAASAVQAIIDGDLQLAVKHLQDEMQRLQPVSSVDVDEAPTPLDLTGYDVPEWANFATMDRDGELSLFHKKPEHPGDRVWFGDRGDRLAKYTGIYITQSGIDWKRSLTPIVRPAKPELRRFDIAPFRDKIPAAAKWVAMDEGGEIYPYSAMPDISICGWTWKVSDIFFETNDPPITTIDPTGIDWRKTLTTVNQRWWERSGETEVSAAELEREHDIIVPSWAQWEAVDSNGNLFVYGTEPPIGAGWWGNPSGDTLKKLLTINLGPIDWRTTKRRIIR